MDKPCKYKCYFKTSFSYFKTSSTKEKSTNITSTDALGILYLSSKKAVLSLCKYHSSLPTELLLHNAYFPQHCLLTQRVLMGGVDATPPIVTQDDTVWRQIKKITPTIFLSFTYTQTFTQGKKKKKIHLCRPRPQRGSWPLYFFKIVYIGFTFMITLPDSENRVCSLVGNSLFNEIMDSCVANTDLLVSVSFPYIDTG